MTEPLPTRMLPKTGLALSELAFGAAPIGNYGRAISDDAASEALEYAWDAGMRYYDTAPLYGAGLSERRLGEFLAARPRADYVVSTKVGRLVHDSPSRRGRHAVEYGFRVDDSLRLEWDFSVKGIRRSIEESLDRLSLDRIDIALIHDPDDFASEALRDAYPALERMRSEGMLTAIGLGMNQWELPKRFAEDTDIDAVMVAGRFTLAEQTAAPLLDSCLRHSVGVIAAAPFNSGLLSRNAVSDQATYNYEKAPTELIEHARELSRVCAAHGVDLADAAVCYPLHHPAVVSVVPGLRTRDHAARAVEAVRGDQPDALWAELEAAGLIASSPYTR